MGMKIDLQSLNDRIALQTTVLMGSMGCVYTFTLLMLIPIWVHTLYNPIFYASSAISLIALPVIMVGNALLGKNAEARALQDHETLMAEMAELKEMHEDLKKLLEKLG